MHFNILDAREEPDVTDTKNEFSAVSNTIIYTFL